MDIRYAGANRFRIDDGSPISTYEALRWLEADGATRVEAKEALAKARQDAEEL